MVLPTVRVRVRALSDVEGYDWTTINAADFDPDAHEPLDGEPAPETGGPGGFRLGPRSGAWYAVLGPDGAEVDKVLGRDNARAAVAALNAGTADGTPV